MPHTLPIEVSTQDVKNILLTAPASHDDLFLLLDCREPDEHSTANIVQARLIPMGTIPSRLQELEPWRDTRIVVHCHHGMRSLRVAQWLREQGFLQVQSMRGGIDAWSTSIDPTVPRY